MAIRTSEGIYLEVLASAPVAGVPIEIDVYGGNNIATMLATLEGAQEPGFTDPFGDIGSGHFRIPTTDPKATGSIIRSGNYVKVKIAGVYRYAFFLENPRKVVASTDGGAGEYWDLGGRGNIAYLERASVYPPGWPAATGTTHEYVGVTAAFIFDELLAAAKARGAIPQLTWDLAAGDGPTRRGGAGRSRTSRGRAPLVGRGRGIPALAAGPLGCSRARWPPGARDRAVRAHGGHGVRADGLRADARRH